MPNQETRTPSDEGIREGREARAELSANTHKARTEHGFNLDGTSGLVARVMVVLPRCEHRGAGHSDARREGFCLSCP